MSDLSVSFCNMTFKNPVMPAAGPNGGDGQMLQRAAVGGAGGLVAKTVSVKPARVPHPNIAATVGRGLINAELWSEIPVEQFIEKEYAIAKSTGLPLIASIGYTAEELAELGPRIEKTGVVDAIEFSIHYLGKSLAPVIEAAKALRKAVSLPILAKLSPAFPDLAAVARNLEPHVDGLIAINSLGPVLDFDIETLSPRLGSEHGFGWISGPPLKPLALRIVYELAQNFSKPIIGVGGISSGRDALQFMMAGASAVQVCSAALLNGQGIYGKIASEMDKWLDEHRYESVQEIQGLYLRKTTSSVDFAEKTVFLNREKCTFCRRCLNSCIHEALYFEAGKIQLMRDNCVGCGLCTTICPTKALTFPDFVRID